jgi:hypothetical protein
MERVEERRKEKKLERRGGETLVKRINDSWIKGRMFMIQRTSLI